MREVVARTSDVKKWFNSILTERKTDLGAEDSDLRNARVVPPDTFIFCGRDGIPIGSFKKSFATLLKDAGVEFDTFGNKRTLYSLRHTYATFRLALRFRCLFRQQGVEPALSHVGIIAAGLFRLQRGLAEHAIKQGADGGMRGDQHAAASLRNRGECLAEARDDLWVIGKAIGRGSNWGDAVHIADRAAV